MGPSGDPLGTIEAILGDLGGFLGSLGQSEARKNENQIRTSISMLDSGSNFGG